MPSLYHPNFYFETGFPFRNSMKLKTIETNSWLAAADGRNLSLKLQLILGSSAGTMVKVLDGLPGDLSSNPTMAAVELKFCE